MSRIAVVTDGIDDGSAGVGTYARGLVSALPQATRHEVTFVHRRNVDEYRGRPELVYPGWGSKLVRKQVLMPRALQAHGFDLVHETFHFPPFFGKRRYRRVMTIHDMTPFVLPQSNMAVRNWLWHRLLVPPLARRADHVLADSECSRRDIVRILGLTPENVSVAYLGADASFRPRDRGEIELVRQRYGLPERFLLFVGTIEPRKNLVRLVRAFGTAAAADRGLALVLAGGLGWRYAAILRAVAGSPARERILMPGRVAGEDLPALYSAATALVYVPLYEGFGLPPLEAMQCGCPVVCSNNSSLPEVVGDAALIIDPADERGIAEAIVRIVDDRHLREVLRAKGLLRARRFSWEQCAAATAAAYERALAA